MRLRRFHSMQVAAGRPFTGVSAAGVLGPCFSTGRQGRARNLRSPSTPRPTPSASGGEWKAEGERLREPDVNVGPKTTYGGKGS
jgi:hypothetical protein